MTGTLDRLSYKVVLPLAPSCVRHCCSWLSFTGLIAESLRRVETSKGIEYTPMKVLDMCFWQIGFMGGRN